METNSQRNSQQTEKKQVECVKCHKHVTFEHTHQTEFGHVCDKCMPECISCHKHEYKENGIETSKGFVCKTCRRKALLKRSIATIVILLLIGSIFCYFMQNKKNTAVGFEGATNIQDSIAVEVQVPTNVFRIETAIAQSSPVVAGQTVENIESFKRVFEKNLDDATEKNENSIMIPSVSILFDFESSKIGSDANTLLNEYAKTYLQTNKQATILVNGYTCNIGEYSVNDWVSKQRAEAVKKVLVSCGIPTEKIEIYWYGKSKNGEFSYPNLRDYRRVIVSIK